jgi:ankyrin repeat/BTB/POZ domain-containing protein 1
MSNIVPKQELELALVAEQKEIDAGFLKEDNPLDLSPGFRDLCDACRRGDLKVCHEKILEGHGVNVNGRDQVQDASRRDFAHVTNDAQSSIILR